MIKKTKFRFVKTIFCVNLIRSRIKKTITAIKGGNKTKINLPLISYYQYIWRNKNLLLLERSHNNTLAVSYLLTSNHQLFLFLSQKEEYVGYLL